MPNSKSCDSNCCEDFDIRNIEVFKKSSLYRGERKVVGIFKLYSKSPQKRRELKKKFLLPYVLYSQIWLNLHVDDCQFGYRYPKIEKQGGVSQCGLAIYIQKYLKAKEELWKTQIFHHAKI
jgi:hypothetical protein